MIKTSIEKLAEEIGFDIGASDDVTQSNLLNGFCKGLSNCMDNQKLETQLCYVADKLTPQSEKVIEHLMEFIDLNRQDRK